MNKNVHGDKVEINAEVVGKRSFILIVPTTILCIILLSNCLSLLLIWIYEFSSLTHLIFALITC